MEIERVSEDGLSREVWRFGVLTPHFGRQGVVNIIVEFYGKEVRASKRHKFVSDPRTRHCTSDMRRYNSGIDATDVPLPEDVIEEAKGRLVINVHRPEVDRRGLI